MKIRAGILSLSLVSWSTFVTAGANEEKFEGYAEWRKGDVLIVDGQRVRTAPGMKFKGEGPARSFSSIPLGYEVKVKGIRLPEGTLIAREMEAKPNGNAMFEGEVKAATNEMETAWVQAGKVYEDNGGGEIQVIGTLHTGGPDVGRVRRIVDRLAPPYLKPGDFRVYVVDNKEWNAFATANGMIVVHSSLLHAMDDDEMAIVLGHELVHATHEHTRRQFKQAMWIQLVAVGAAVATEAVDRDKKKTRAITGLAASFSLLAWRNGYGRDCEDQADRVGLRYAYEAGYDIRKGPRLWKKFADKYGDSGKLVNFFFGDHSVSTQRAANLEREIARNYSGAAAARP